MFQSPQICYRDRCPCKGSERKLVLNLFIIKNGGQLRKILYNSRAHFTWVRWKFLQNFFIFFNRFPTDIFNLHPSQNWWLFSIFRVSLWRNTQRHIKTIFVQVNKKGSTSLSMIFLSFGSRLSRIQTSREKGQHF